MLSKTRVTSIVLCHEERGTDSLHLVLVQAFDDAADAGDDRKLITIQHIMVMGRIGFHSLFYHAVFPVPPPRAFV